MTEIVFLKTKKQMKALQSLCEEFAELAGKELSWKHWHSAVGGLVQNGIASCIVIRDDEDIVGILAYSYFPDLITSELSATEICWYIKPDYRSKDNAQMMLDMMENEAREKGCKFLNMVCLENDRTAVMGRYYRSIGFDKVETSYQKVL
jgi:predicted acetyltransferase|tara:strand:- start:14537 stop:14983 length:447 start_codon:yes stop_codon:yes gene_type:complete